MVITGLGSDHFLWQQLLSHSSAEAASCGVFEEPEAEVAAVWHSSVVEP